MSCHIWSRTLNRKFRTIYKHFLEKPNNYHNLTGNWYLSDQVMKNKPFLAKGFHHWITKLPITTKYLQDGVQHLIKQFFSWKWKSSISSRMRQNLTGAFLADNTLDCDVEAENYLEMTNLCWNKFFCWLGIQQFWLYTWIIWWIHCKSAKFNTCFLIIFLENNKITNGK